MKETKEPQDLLPIASSTQPTVPSPPQQITLKFSTSLNIVNPEMTKIEEYEINITFVWPPYGSKRMQASEMAEIESFVSRRKNRSLPFVVCTARTCTCGVQFIPPAMSNQSSFPSKKYNNL